MLAELHQIITKDGIPLEGLFFKPKLRGKAAAIWLSGLTGRFSKNPERTNTLAKELTRKGIAFAIFDHRGASIIESFKIKKGRGKGKYILAGTGFEKFEHSRLDIEATIRFLRKHGYKKIFLLGHSTGANKSAYFYWKSKGRGVSGVGLLGPLSDIPGMKEESGRNYQTLLKTAEKMIKRGGGKELLPLKLTKGRFWSAERFWSIAREGSKEDTFPYYNPKRKFYWTKKIHTPFLVLIGEKDQYADPSVTEILDAFKKQIPEKWFTGVILKASDHSFNSREKELATAVERWATMVLNRKH